MKACLLAACLAVTLAATGQQPAFDAISIKPYESGTGHPLSEDPTRFVWPQANLHNLILRAYGIQTFQLVGEPDWFHRDYFSIAATTAQPTNHAAKMQMLQTTLAKRFELQLDVEAKSMLVYALVPATGGIKLHACENPSCDGEFLTPPPGMNLVHFGALSPQSFVEIIDGLNWGNLGHPIIDHSGIAGEVYPLAVWSDPTPSAVASGSATSGTAQLHSSHVPEGKAFIAMLEKNFGLTLELRTEGVPVYTVVHAEHPTAN